MLRQGTCSSCRPPTISFRIRRILWVVDAGVQARRSDRKTVMASIADNEDFRTVGAMGRSAHRSTADCRVCVGRHESRLLPTGLSMFGIWFPVPRRQFSFRSLGASLTGYLRSSVSADGRFVAFTRWQPSRTGDTNGSWDVFVHDREEGTTERVSVSSAELQVMPAVPTPNIRRWTLCCLHFHGGQLGRRRHQRR